jgi:uncharacterized membrane protein
MSQIAVLVFEAGGLSKAFYASQIQDEPDISQDRARVAYEEIERSVKDGKFAVESGTIAVKDEVGIVRLRKTSEWTAKSGAGWGAFWGLLVGLIFAGPLLGLLD